MIDLICDIDSIETHILNLKIPFFTEWLNKVYWRLFHASLKKSKYIQSLWFFIATIDYISMIIFFIKAWVGLRNYIERKICPFLKKQLLPSMSHPTFGVRV
jgi:hypothetical protein